MSVVDTRIGSVLAGYRIEGLLGRGGMSSVYLAEHLRLQRKVALKLLAPELATRLGLRSQTVGSMPPSTTGTASSHWKAPRLEA